MLHKADREYIWHFFDEGANQGDSIDAVRGACGFCAVHVEMLRRIEIEGMKSTLSVSTMFADTFQGIADDLGSLNTNTPFQRSQCPACANREERLRANAHYLLDELAVSPGYRAKFEASPGLCFPHFELVWNAADHPADRELILAVQNASVRSLLAELEEHVRKHDAKFRHEPKGSEADSWQRAIYLTAGWPAPPESAAEPEGSR